MLTPSVAALNPWEPPGLANPAPVYWIGVELRRFSTWDDHAKAPEHWRSPKPRGKDLIRVQTEGVSRIASQRDFHERRVDILSLPDG
jgi:hypothetical protein